MTFLAEKRPDWFKEGLCWATPELAGLFHPEDEQPAEYHLAREYCNRCPVKQQCRDYAINNSIMFGMWGGLTPRERERYRKNPKAFVLEQRTCEECDKSLTGPQRLYCSSTCIRRAHRKRKSRGQIFPIPCRQCGQEFVRCTPGQLMCGPECRKASARERQATRRTTAVRRFACWTCDKPVALVPSGRLEKYCSDACRRAARLVTKGAKA